MRSFAPGEPVVLRELWRGRVFAARPATVVRDDPELITLLVPAGVTCAVPIGPDGEELRICDRPFRLELRERGPTPVLSFAWPGEPFAVLRDERAVELGLFSAAGAERFRADGHRAIDRILRREPPFDRDRSGRGGRGGHEDAILGERRDLLLGQRGEDLWLADERFLGHHEGRRGLERHAITRHGKMTPSG